MDWTPEMDRKLEIAVEGGQSRRAYARENGLSENAVIARYNRIKGIQFHSDAERMRLEKVRTAAARARREKRETAVMKKAVARLERGGAREHAIIFARDKGVRLQTIANHFGFTRERARQIALGQ